MAAGEEVVILTRLAGVREFIANTQAEAAALGELAVRTDTVGTAFGRTSERGYLMNQTLFTMRRLMYGATLGVIALGAEVLHLGYNYDLAMQQAQVSLRPVFSSTKALNNELIDLFNFTKYTPFQFKDVTTAFRQMYGAMHPLGISVVQVNGYIAALTDALAFAGRTTPAALNRVAVAFQHIAFQGRITGQSITQLARDGLPVYAALRKELGLTADQMHNIGKLGIPSQVALNAITKYIETTPGYEGAAKRIATQSLGGIFTTFKDNLSQLFGTFEMKPFLGAQNAFVQLNAFFDKINTVAAKGGGVAGVMNAIAHAIMPNNPGVFLFFWSQLSADVTDAWQIFTTIISTISHSSAVWGTLLLALTGIHLALSYIIHNEWLLVPVLKVAIGLFILWKTYLIAVTLWEGYLGFATVALTGETKALTAAQLLFKGAVIAGMAAVKGAVIAQGLWQVLMTGSIVGTNGQFLAMTRLQKLVRAFRVFLLSEVIPVFTATWASITAMAAATWEFTAALLANPITWIVIAIVSLIAILVVLYFKWSAFHNAVNSTVVFLKNNSALVSAALQTAFGPLFAAVEAIKLLHHYYNDIKSPIKAVANAATGGHTGGFWGTVEKGAVGSLESAIPGVGLFAGLVGGAHIKPSIKRNKQAPVSDLGSLFNLPEAWMNGNQDSDKHIHLTVNLNGKKIAEAHTKVVADAKARS